MDSKNTITKCDPSWNYVARSSILYVLPFALLSVSLHRAEIGWSRDFWVPIIWGFVVPALNTRRWMGMPWALKDFMDRNYYPITLALMHGSAWFLCVSLMEATISAMVAFFAIMFVFDAVLIRYRVLAIYAIPLRVHKKGALMTTLYFGVYWWLFVACGLGATHAWGSDTLLSIALCSAAMILPAQAALTLVVARLNKPERLEGIKRVAVIGGGWSGIYATKWLTECGIEATCFESSKHIGGNWYYKADRSSGVFRNTRVTSSKPFLHASDFPMDENLPDFPHHTQVLQYLMQYVDHFDISERFRLNTQVISANRSEDGWKVVVKTDGEDSEELSFDAVVNSSGPHLTPSLDIATHPLYSRLDGRVMHTADFKDASDVQPGERILVVGAGESAADVVTECVAAGGRVHWSSYYGQWFADRNIGPFPADHLTAFGLRVLLGRFLNFEYWIRRFLIAGFINLAWGRGGHGIPGWLPTTPYLHQFLNKSRDAVLEVYRGTVTTHGAVCGIDGSRVEFEDADESIGVDRIILATGYKPHWPFLEEQPQSLYKKVFHSDDPTLAHVGTARPILGSIPSLSEAQARWMAHVFAGKVSLPCRNHRLVAVYFDKLHHEKWYRDTSRLGVLVDQEVYSNELASYVNAHVHWFKLLLCQPRTFLLLLWSPWLAFKHQLNHPDRMKRKAAHTNIAREMPGVRNPVHWLTKGVAPVCLLFLIAIPLSLWLIPLKYLSAAVAILIGANVCFCRMTEFLPRLRLFEKRPKVAPVYVQPETLPQREDGVDRPESNPPVAVTVNEQSAAIANRSDEG